MEPITYNKHNILAYGIGMQVLHYGETGFGINDWICMQLKRYAIFAIVPNSGQPGRC